MAKQQLDIGLGVTGAQAAQAEIVKVRLELEKLRLEQAKSNSTGGIAGSFANGAGSLIGKTGSEVSAMAGRATALAAIATESFKLIGNFAQGIGVLGDETLSTNEKIGGLVRTIPILGNVIEDMVENVAKSIEYAVNGRKYRQWERDQVYADKRAASNQLFSQIRDELRTKGQFADNLVGTFRDPRNTTSADDAVMAARLAQGNAGQAHRDEMYALQVKIEKARNSGAGAAGVKKLEDDLQRLEDAWHVQAQTLIYATEQAIKAQGQKSRDNILSAQYAQKESAGNWSMMGPEIARHAQELSEKTRSRYYGDRASIRDASSGEIEDLKLRGSLGNFAARKQSIIMEIANQRQAEEDRIRQQLDDRNVSADVKAALQKRLKAIPGSYDFKQNMALSEGMGPSVALAGASEYRTTAGVGLMPQQVSRESLFEKPKKNIEEIAKNIEAIAKFITSFKGESVPVWGGLVGE